MLRFVILEHDHPSLHWDFMLEEDGHLATWRMPCPPSDAPVTLMAERIGDHRKFYLDHEGPVSGGRGNVRRWDGGEYLTISVSGTDWAVRLSGERWVGLGEMRRTIGSTWLIRFEQEAHTK